jgi:tetratricopeptide (TPR) repeat protein
MTAFVDTATRLGADVVEVDVNQGPAASYTGLRRALDALRECGASFGEIPVRYTPEWTELFPDEDTGSTRLEEIALTASERRLHRESEQVYRVLSVAATALCTGSVELDRTVAVRGVGGTDLSSLRGFMRAVEHASVMPGARLMMTEPTRTRVPAGVHADYRTERVACLRRMGVDVTVGDLIVDLSELPDSVFTPVSEEGALYVEAVNPDSSRTDRIAAALAYSRRAFFSANWEGMAIVAKDAIGLLRGLSDSHVAEVLAKADRKDGLAEALEFETGILRSTADVRAFLLKVLGIQAAFRGDQDTALDYFRAMRAAERGVSAELVSQSHLYSALTLSKRKLQVSDAVAELDRGFAAVVARPGEPDSVRRERGWLHNLRGLTLFAQKQMGAAFEHEKQALACLDGLTDASSAHLRINLYSNISVLQENAGKAPQALATWEKFKQASGAANAAFRKHHSYRSGGIRLLVGERDGALADLHDTLDNAKILGDDFHECEVRLELGALHARSDESADAEEQFARAEAAARRIGDPYRIAMALAGRAGTSDERVAQSARLSLTQPVRAQALADAGDDVLSHLPTLRTKLNRPFDLINFQD